MGESHSLFRIVLLLGFVLLMGSVLATPWVYVGQPLPSNSAWGQFSNGIQNFPSFNNPFAVTNSVVSKSLLPQAPFCYDTDNSGVCNGAITPIPPGCSSVATGWQCLLDPTGSGDTKYVPLDGTDGANNNNFRVNISTDTFDNYAIQDVVINAWCRTEGTTGATFVFSVHNSGVAFTAIVKCPASAIYQQVTANYGHQIVSSPFGVPTILFISRNQTIDQGVKVRFSAVSVTVLYVANQVTCTGNAFENTGCQIANGIRTLYLVALAIINFFIFIAQVVVWFVLMIGIFFGALISVLTIPGAPPLIAGLIGIIVIGCLFFVAIVIMGKIRGTGNVG